MTNGWLLFEQYVYGIGQFFLNPLLYLFVLFIYLHYRKQMLMERQLFAVRIQSPLTQTIRSIALGLIGGAIVTVSSGVLGIVIQITDVWIVSCLAIALAFIRIRYLCLAYATAVLTFLHGIALLIPDVEKIQGIGTVWGWLIEAKPLPLLALVALLHVVEALMIRWNRGKDASPLFVEGKRGRIVGAYQLESFWLTPLMILVPTSGSGGWTDFLYPGWPLFSGDVAFSSLGLLLIPAITGFSALTQSQTPVQKAQEVSRELVLYALLLFGLAYAAVWLPALLWLAGMFAFFGHEGLVLLSKYREDNSAPYFIQSSQGLKVMAVIPDTPAHEMGILPGEIIVKVNGVAVTSKEQLYPALQINSAFCKMEVLTWDREIKFVQCAVYAGHHHQLGIIVVPDAMTQHFVNIRKRSLVALLKQRKERLKLEA